MRVATLIALLFLTACARWAGVSESWHGRSLDELVAYWGPPDNSYKYDNGSRVVTFKHQHQVSGFNPYAPYQSAVYKCTASFTMDPRGIIISSKVDGNLGGCNSLFRDKSKAP